MGRRSSATAAASEESELRAAKRGYRAAKEEGNREEEARWANVMGDILKRRGEYVEALRWLQIDHDLSSDYLPARHLLPTCQSLGEVLLRLDRFDEALLYQKKHLELAKASEIFIEQQRASTQLGRTYHEMFLKSEDDHSAIRKAKKYFKLSMELARELKENAHSENSLSFLKEYIDAHNNIGMLNIDLDNLEEAETILFEALQICDDEEIAQNDDARSRLHHNLGRLYIELRKWGNARHHIEKDILICKNISHLQGEAKGYINFGELHCRIQEYDEAIRCYQKAFNIVKEMEDEDVLISQINENIRIVKEAMHVLEEIKKDEQKLKKITRICCEARGTSNERRCLSDQLKCLDNLTEKCRDINAWPRHREFAKRKKRVASELCEKEKLGDSYICIGESYQKLRNFNKARKWYMKGWNVYRSIGNLEGEALAKINIGVVLDSSGDWASALQAFEEGYRLAVEGKIYYVQLSALENIHYSHMIRFDNVEKAKQLLLEIQDLKSLLNKDVHVKDMKNDYCSETESEGTDLSEKAFGTCRTQSGDNSPSSNAHQPATGDEISDHVLLASLVRPRKKNYGKRKLPQMEPCSTASCILPTKTGDSHECLSDNQQSSSRKRARVIISDDEEYGQEEGIELDRVERSQTDYGASDKDRNHSVQVGHFAVNEMQDGSNRSTSKDVQSSCTPVYVEESASSFKSKSPKFSADKRVDVVANGCKLDRGHVPFGQFQSNDGAGSNAAIKNEYTIICNIGNTIIFVSLSSCTDGEYLSTESLKVEVACVYYLQLWEEKISKGLLPLIGAIKCSGKKLSPFEAIGDLKRHNSMKIEIEVVIDGWVPKRLMNLYIDYCEKSSEAPNMRLLKNLYNLEVSEDEVIISDCGLQDMSISPFLDALQAHNAVALLDISHNLLGNATMEKLQQMFLKSNQKYGGLILDLHFNRFGPTSLFQICECPIMLSRLEVLNLSGNRLTDSSSSYLFSLLENCKALYSLNIEQCSITSRTILKLSEALHDGSILSRLFVGRNTPISVNAIGSLLSKLATLKRFSELSLCGIRLNKPALDHVCQLARTSNLSTLLLGETCIGAVGTERLTEALLSGPQELIKLDLSNCLLTSHDCAKAFADIASLSGILELNLRCNSIGQEGCDALRVLLIDPLCSLKSLVLDECQLGFTGILQILQALSVNESLEEIHLAGNADIAHERTLQHDIITGGSNADLCIPEVPKEDETTQRPATGHECSSFTSSTQENISSAYNPLIQELCEAVAGANNLRLLNLSNNGFDREAIDALYTSWSSSSRCSLARKHFEGETVHFWIVGRKCCGLKPCCKRD